MTDNKPNEKQAESLIEHHLLKHKFKVAKPSFDQHGADLLILDGIEQKNTRFLKIQSKLRTISDKGNSLVDIQQEYVTDNFVLFLYVNREEEDERLYVFFKEDIETWRVRKGAFWLTISEGVISGLGTNIFNRETAREINVRLMRQDIKPYTSIIIDGIFLEKAIHDTKSLYAEIWPEKVFKEPKLKNVVKNLLRYNQFNAPNKTIKCILFLSKHHSLQTSVILPKHLGINSGDDEVEFTIQQSDKIIGFQVLEQLERIVNAENVLLVADNVLYQDKLNELATKGVDLILIKQKVAEGSRMYTSFRYGDIAYPLGRSIGLKGYEL